MTHLTDILDTAALERLIADGYITRRPHQAASLHILNYTPKAAYEPLWTPETTQCRGLIVDDAGEIVARPFDKFFNLGQTPETQPDALPVGGFEVTDKLDGSLGISFVHEGETRIATRGSFHSEQADWATAHWRRCYDHIPVPADVTLLFKIVYPENRVVVDYHDAADLYLIGMRRLDGYDYPYADLAAFAEDTGLPVVPARDIHTLAELDALAQTTTDEEGWVIRFLNGLRVKVKCEEYKKLHRLLTKVTARDIWEHVSTGKSLAPLLDAVPDEFYTWVQTTAAGLAANYAELEAYAGVMHDSVRALPTRKEQAIALQDYSPALRPVVFRMLDGKNYDDILWKQLYPAASKPFKQDEEG